jgi:hypothetical protein
MIQGCFTLFILSPRGTSGERTEERGNQQQRASSPQPSPPADGGEGEIQELNGVQSMNSFARFRFKRCCCRADVP